MQSLSNQINLRLFDVDGSQTACRDKRVENGTQLGLPCFTISLTCMTIFNGFQDVIIITQFSLTVQINVACEIAT